MRFTGTLRMCKHTIFAVALLAGSLMFLGTGCVSQQKESDRYIDQVLAQNLGDVEALRNGGAADNGKIGKTERKTTRETTRSGRTAAAQKQSARAAAETGGDMPDTPAAENQVQTGGDKIANNVTIQPDTVLSVSVDEDPSLDGRYTVNDYCAIDFGYVGLVLLTDMTVKDAEAKLHEILENRFLKKASVTVRIAKASYDRIGVNGAVLAPGLLKIGPGSTISLNDALLRAGGLKLEAASARVKIVRGGLLSPFGVVANGEVYSLVTDDGKLAIPPLTLANNDLVYVYTQQSQTASLGEKRVIVLGEVNRKGVVQFADNEPCTLMYLLFKMGGLPRFAKTSAVRIVRRDKDGREREIKVDATELLREGDPKDDVVLEDGDRVIVPVKSFSFL